MEWISPRLRFQWYGAFVMNFPIWLLVPTLGSTKPNVCIQQEGSSRIPCSVHSCSNGSFSTSIFFVASRYARITPNFNIVSKRARTHTHTRVNCATLIVGISKCSHSVGGVIKIPDRMDKSEATIPRRWRFVHELSYPVARSHLGQHKTKCMHSVGGVIKNPLLCPFSL